MRLLRVAYHDIFKSKRGEISFNFSNLPTRIQTKFQEFIETGKVEGNLYFYSTDGITVLPDNFHVTGELSLKHCGIKVLPEYLRVDGALDLAFSKVTELPKGLRVGGSLNLWGTPIKTIPPDAIIKGKIYFGLE